MKKKIINKLLDNINYSKKKGMIIASPSNDPPYKYHWIRDSALVMRVIIDLYKNTNKNKYLILIINYLESEYHIQNLNTITGLGEPKINIDGTPYNQPWGRPQNDGPALRGINLIKIYNILKDDYPNLVNNMIIPMLIKDINYILNNYKKISFDLWEEIKGWHFYTRLVQIKFIKDIINFKQCDKLEINNNNNIKLIYESYKKNIMDHLDNNSIISSFDENGNIIRYDDASILLGFSHIDYDFELMKLFPIKNILQVCNNLLNYFNQKYNHDYNLIGRYQNDKYYNGHSWIICTLALCQFYKYIKNIKLNKKADSIFEYIICIDENLNLSEQYDPVNKKKLSACKLTWNYSEMYMYLKLL